jgi:hypothetical protein
VKLTGHEEGVAQLKALHAEDKSAIRFLVDEARTNTDLKARFRGKDGIQYLLIVDPKSGDLVVEPAPEQRPSKLPPAK